MARQIITIEKPIEFHIRPKKSLIRQREVGRDTPSFQRGLMDALRQDPDVILVGEIRSVEEMQYTLSAAETGHLVLTSMHSSSCVEGLLRLISSFPPAGREQVQAQLADALLAVITQQLIQHPKAKQRIPECEVLLSNKAVKNCIRTGNLHRIASIIETSRMEGMFTRTLYRAWLDQKEHFSSPNQTQEDVMPSRTSLPASIKKKTPPVVHQSSKDGIIDLDNYDEDPASIIASLRKK